MATIKLRVRAASGGPTTRVQVPPFVTLQVFKDILGPLISLPPSSFSLSLNKKDEIEGPGTALLSCFGVTSGDLLYYIMRPESTSGSFLAGSLSQQPDGVAESSDRASRDAARERAQRASVSVASDPNPQTSSRPGRAVSNPNTRRELCAAAATRRATLASDRAVGASDSSSLLVASAGSSRSATITGSVSGAMDVYATQKSVEAESDGKAAAGHRVVPIPDLLQRVLSAEIRNVRQASAYLVLAVHAVMLETGFVRIGTVESRSPLEGYALPAGWSALGLVNLTYTLPEIARATESSSSRAIGEEALLRCRIVGNAVVVYGAVTGSSVQRLSLPLSKFLRENVKIREVAVDSSKDDEAGLEAVHTTTLLEGGNSGEVSREAESRAAMSDNEENVFRDIFGLWKEVKDSLSLPLLTVMCEKAGLPPPPSLLRLPTELKIKVLDSLHSLALANISCACSELRFLATSEELWKQRYKDEFGASGEKAPGGRGWKSAFVREFKQRKRREEERRQAERRFRSDIFPPGIIMRPPSFPPHFIGLDYFQNLEGPPRGGFGGLGPDVGGGGFRSLPFQSGPPGNPMVLPGRGQVGGAYDDYTGVSFPNIDVDSVHGSL